MTRRGFTVQEATDRIAAWKHFDYRSYKHHQSQKGSLDLRNQGQSRQRESEPGAPDQEGNFVAHNSASNFRKAYCGSEQESQQKESNPRVSTKSPTPEDRSVARGSAGRTQVTTESSQEPQPHNRLDLRKAHCDSEKPSRQEENESGAPGESFTLEEILVAQKRAGIEEARKEAFYASRTDHRLGAVCQRCDQLSKIRLYAATLDSIRSAHGEELKTIIEHHSNALQHHGPLLEESQEALKAVQQFQDNKPHTIPSNLGEILEQLVSSSKEASCLLHQIEASSENQKKRRLKERQNLRRDIEQAVRPFRRQVDRVEMALGCIFNTLVETSDRLARAQEASRDVLQSLDEQVLGGLTPASRSSITDAQHHQAPTDRESDELSNSSGFAVPQLDFGQRGELFDALSQRPHTPHGSVSPGSLSDDRRWSSPGRPEMPGTPDIAPLRITKATPVLEGKSRLDERTEEERLCPKKRSKASLEQWSESAGLTNNEAKALWDSVLGVRQHSHASQHFVATDVGQNLSEDAEPEVLKDVESKTAEGGGDRYPALEQSRTKNLEAWPEEGEVRARQHGQVRRGSERPRKISIAARAKQLRRDTTWPW